MKVSEQSKARFQACGEALAQTPEAAVATREKLSLSKMVVSTFGKFDVALRARAFEDFAKLVDRRWGDVDLIADTAQERVIHQVLGIKVRGKDQ